GQGMENALNLLNDNPDLANEIEKNILVKLGVGVRPDAATTEGTAPSPIPDGARASAGTTA
ncbi:DNA recombination/repair protein RecA, partial [Streptomyces sp. NPDC059586]